MSETTYKESGVDIDAANDLVDSIKSMAGQATRPEVLSGIGGFAGAFALQQNQYKEPVLIACTDGVGTKLKLAIDLKNYSGLGQDLVAMCVNDMICAGAEPLFFLDYLATGRLDTNQAAQVVQSISESLQSINCALLGGETAEMPGLYQTGDFDIAGFSVGVVEKSKLINGPAQVQSGDVILGLESSGVHSNGFSLVHKIFEKNNISWDLKTEFAPDGLGQKLLEPTRLYVKAVLEVLQTQSVSALSHITGGGLVENLPRVYSESLQANLHKDSLTPPALFQFLQEQGNVPEEEMWRVFNMGIGFCMIVPEENALDTLTILEAQNCPAKRIGTMQTKANSHDEPVIFS